MAISPHISPCVRNLVYPGVVSVKRHLQTCIFTRSHSCQPGTCKLNLHELTKLLQYPYLTCSLLIKPNTKVPLSVTFHSWIFMALLSGWSARTGACIFKGWHQIWFRSTADFLFIALPELHWSTPGTVTNYIEVCIILRLLISYCFLSRALTSPRKWTHQQHVWRARNFCW